MASELAAKGLSLVLVADLASVTALTQIESATKDLDVGLLVAAADCAAQPPRPYHGENHG
jgi:hypothetical protein